MASEQEETWSSQVVTELREAGRQVFPQIDLTPEELSSYLHKFVAGTDSENRAPLIDLYLACACVAAHPKAAECFHRRYGEDIHAILGRYDASGSLLEDAAQIAETELLVASPGSLPKIAKYQGRGTLLAFVRIVVIRTALQNLRRPKNTVSVEEALADNSSDDDSELAYLKHTYRSEFKAAFASAIDSLAPRQRTLLRYHLVDQLTVDQVGAVYSVHRATAARWVQSAREALLAQTREALMEKLTISKDEFESIVRLINSDFDVSVKRHFASKE